MILVDTSAFIEFLNQTGSRHHNLIREFIEAGGGDICFTDIVISEILQGIRDDRHFKETRDSLLSFKRFSLKCPESYIEAAALYRSCRKKGLTIRRPVDCLIAQVAIENGLVLLHNDRDFEAIARATRLRLLTV